jgi:hypothetical protein
MVVRTLSNIGMRFRRSHGTSRPGRMIVHEDLVLLFGK